MEPKYYNNCQDCYSMRNRTVHLDIKPLPFKSGYSGYGSVLGFFLICQKKIEKSGFFKRN